MAISKENESSLPVFRMDEYTMEEFASLHMERYCSLEEYASREDGILRIECIKAKSEHMKHFFETLGSYKKERPLKIRLDNTEWPLNYDDFTPVANQIISLKLTHYNGIKSSDFKSLNLPNLLELEFGECRDISLFPGDFTHYSQLRVLSFKITNTFSVIEKGAFDGLNNLKTLTLESKYGQHSDEETVTNKGEVILDSPPTPDRAPFLLQLHSSPEFKWLRDIYAEKPYLLQSRARGEIYEYGGFLSYERKREDIYIPVDCAQRGNKGFLPTGQTEYSVNLPQCKNGS